eukprot:COSAG01_NODE_12906_length_1668_cov_2.025526_1_plen_213_part_00
MVYLAAGFGALVIVWLMGAVGAWSYKIATTMLVRWGTTTALVFYAPTRCGVGLPGLDGPLPARASQGMAVLRAARGCATTSTALSASLSASQILGDRTSGQEEAQQRPQQHEAGARHCFCSCGMDVMPAVSDAGGGGLRAQHPLANSASPGTLPTSYLTHLVPYPKVWPPRPSHGHSHSSIYFTLVPLEIQKPQPHLVGPRAGPRSAPTAVP